MAEAIDMGAADPAWVAASLSHIIKNLRQQDRDEINAMHGQAPELVIPQSVLLSSHGWIIVHQGEPVAVFGAAPSPLSGVGIVWMLGTDGLLSCGHTVGRQTRQHLDAMHTRYPLLWNYIDARNSVSMRWLEWGGFELLGDHLAPTGHLFHIFARSRHCQKNAAPAAYKEPSLSFPG